MAQASYARRQTDLIKSIYIPIFSDSEKNRAGALLTLKTIRVGFPTVPITACLMRGCDTNVVGYAPLYRFLGYAPLCRLSDDIYWDTNSPFTTNDQLIKSLVETEENGFAVIDSDVVFFDNCENFQTNALIAGELIPNFYCPIANSDTVSRLHTAFFVVPDPPKLRAAIKDVYTPMLPKFCPFNPFSPVTTFLGRRPLFYDSCANLYHALGGEAFNEAMLNKFEHCYSGSYAHLLPWPHAAFLESVYEKPSIAKGFRNVMNRFFENRKAA